jgi:hypothetical protein
MPVLIIKQLPSAPGLEGETPLPRLGDLRSFAPHLARPPAAYEETFGPDELSEVSAYLTGYAARLRFPTGLTPTDASMRGAREEESHRWDWLMPKAAAACATSFANGWNAANGALPEERP